jgi:hypothetical protein
MDAHQMLGLIVLQINGQGKGRLIPRHGDRVDCTEMGFLFVDRLCRGKHSY